MTQRFGKGWKDIDPGDGDAMSDFLKDLREEPAEIQESVEALAKSDNIPLAGAYAKWLLENR